MEADFGGGSSTVKSSRGAKCMEMHRCLVKGLILEKGLQAFAGSPAYHKCSTITN